LHDFEEIEFSRQSCRSDCEYQGGKLSRLLSGLRPRILPLRLENGRKIWNEKYRVKRNRGLAQGAEKKWTPIVNDHTHKRCKRNALKLQ
jgi:hypothetical protein